MYVVSLASSLMVFVSRQKVYTSIDDYMKVRHTTLFQGTGSLPLFFVQFNSIFPPMIIHMTVFCAMHANEGCHYLSR